MATYSEMITKVRNYLDRDSTIITDTQITNFLNYAADRSYRTLRVPAHEIQLDFTVSSGDLISESSSGVGSEIKVPVPNDLIELIYIQKKGTGVVWNQKVDGRTFHDRFADKKDYNYYTRIGTNFLLHGNLNTGDVLEFSYYRRESAIDAKYAITTGNYLVQAIKGITTMTAVASATGTSSILYFAIANTSGNRDIVNGISGVRPTDVSSTSTGSTTNAFHMEPSFQVNWLRDENERIILYGALAESFLYLNEPESAQAYELKYNQEIEALNSEEKKRVSTGGNTSISFSGMGLI